MHAQRAPQFFGFYYAQQLIQIQKNSRGSSWTAPTVFLDLYKKGSLGEPFYTDGLMGIRLSKWYLQPAARICTRKLWIVNGADPLTQSWLL